MREVSLCPQKIRHFSSKPKICTIQARSTRRMSNSVTFISTTENTHHCYAGSATAHPTWRKHSDVWQTSNVSIRITKACRSCESEYVTYNCRVYTIHRLVSGGNWCVHTVGKKAPCMQSGGSRFAPGGC